MNRMLGGAICIAAAALAAGVPAPVAGTAWTGSAAHLGRVTPPVRKDAKFKRHGR